MGKDQTIRLDAAEVPAGFADAFRMAQEYVKDYFGEREEDSRTANIAIRNERYILVRAASMSVDFFETVKNLYLDDGEEKARNVAWSMLYDVAHAIGKADANNFHEKMNLQEPLEKLSAGPIHFAHSGWAFVRILPQSRPNPDESYFLVYDHPFSFESHSWVQQGKRSTHPVCVMNAGYSAGWCEESFGLDLVATEIMCRAKGDEHCRFVMASPSRIEDYLRQYLHQTPGLVHRVSTYQIPGFFQRKKLEQDRSRAIEELKKARDELETRVHDRTTDLERANRSLVQEIAERRRAEEALAESEKQFRAIATTAADSILVVDVEGRLVYSNPSAQNLFGIDLEELSRIRLPSLIAPKDPDAAPAIGTPSELLRLATADGFCELNALRRDKTTFPIEVATSVVRYRGKDHTLFVIRDVTKRKQMEEEVFKSKQMESLGVLAGGLAHDFNNILTGILGNLSVALNDKSVGGALLKRLKEAENACQHAKFLANRLLTFSKGGAPVTEMASIAELTRQTVDFSLSGSKTRATFDLPEDIWPVKIDRGQIGQVLNNIVMNAKQAMPAGGTIRIAVRNQEVGPNELFLLEKGSYVNISIRDEGPGILEENLSSIFDPYFTAKPGGTGLGLTLALSIIMNHKGTITVHSTPGEGATFSVYLPASPAAEPADSLPGSSLPVGSGDILVMDDSEIIIAVAGAILRRLGYTPRFARDGAGAIELYRDCLDRSCPFDAVIMDLTIPGGMGGLEAVREILAIDPQARVIVSTGYTDDPVMSNYQEYGFRGAVAKPFDVFDLGRELKRVLELPDSGR